MSRTGTTFPLLLVGLLVLAGCGGSDNPPARQGAAVQSKADAKFPMTIETCGREVTLKRPPERVMTVGAEAPTLLWAAGAAGRIKVRAANFGSTYAPAEAAFKDAPLIARDEEPTKEVILGQQPDLLLSYGLTETPWEEVDRLGIPQIVVSGQCDNLADDGPRLDGPASFQDIYDDIELYGRIFNTEDVAAKAVADYRQHVAAVKQRFQGGPKRTAAVLAAYPSTIYVYGPVSISNVQLETVGLTNAFPDIAETRYIELNVEELLARNPDVLIVTSEHGGNPDVGVQRVREIPGAGRLTAVRDNHLIPIDNQAIIGGILPIELLDDLANKVAGLK